MRISDGSSDVCSSDLLLKKHRGGARIGHDTAYDHMFLDGLEDAYEAGRAMGTFAQDTADAYQLSRSEEHTSELQSLMRISYAVFCLKKKNKNKKHPITHITETI